MWETLRNKKSVIDQILKSKNNEIENFIENILET